MQPLKVILYGVDTQRHFTYGNGIFLGGFSPPAGSIPSGGSGASLVGAAHVVEQGLQRQGNDILG